MNALRRPIQQLFGQMEAAVDVGVLTSKEAGRLLAVKLDTQSQKRVSKRLRVALERFELFVAKPGSYEYH